MTTEKILIVDDIATNRKLLRQMLLKMAGYSVVEAVNGKEAIALFEAEQPDLILMDINMPEMDGMQSTYEIKKLSAGNYIPIIFVTALTAESSLANALDSGGDDFISKPFDTDVLKSKIRAHLRIRELNQQLISKNTQLKAVNQQLTHEQELIEHFFNSALQQSYLDQQFIQYHMSSMSAFNGDIFLAARSPQDSLYIVMGDFTGHGLTAAMGTLPVAMIFFEMVANNTAVADIARELNSQLYRLMPTSMFFAATLLELNSRGDILTAWKGGMPESYWVAADGHLKGTIQSRHMPLGILHDSGFNAETEIFSVAENDKFYLYSDGVTEAHRPNGEMFGHERLQDVLVSNSENRINKVLQSLKEFIGSTDQNDDITLVELNCRALANAAEEQQQDEPVAEFLPWDMSVRLSNSQLRNGDPLHELNELIGALPVLQRHKGTIAVLLSEIYFNALDYSILGLDNIRKDNEEQFEAYYKLREDKLQNLQDASITFTFSFIIRQNHPYLLIRISDSGTGYRGHRNDVSLDKLHGRGLEIIQSLCESAEFSNAGKTLELTYPL